MNAPHTIRGWVQLAAAVAALLGTVGSGAWAITATFATKAEVREVAGQTVQTIQSLRCDIIIQKLNELAAKERAGQMTEYDRVRRDQLEAQRDRVCD